MAGAGYKLFNTGDVLTAAQVNTYLQEQVVMVFASAAARTTALSGVVAEGMVTYLKDTDALEIYSGSAWVGYGSGDITGVTAGTGISGGGTSGTVTITNSMATEITAAGDIIVGTGSGTFDNLPIGTTGQVLTADTTVSPYKVKWAAASAGALTLITQGTFSSSAGVNIDSCFTSTYTNYLVVWDRITSASTQGQFQFRSGGSTNTNATYNWSSYYIPLGSSPLGYEVGGSQTAVSTGMGESSSITSVTMLYVFQPQASQYTTYTWTNQHGGGYTQWGGGRFANTTSFDGIRLAPASGNFTSGSYQVYGLAKS